MENKIQSMAAASPNEVGTVHGEAKESLKLRISTNQADGTSKIISNHVSSSSSSHNHNHVSKHKDGSRNKDGASKSKHDHSGEKEHKKELNKDHKHKEITKNDKNNSHGGDKHKVHKNSLNHSSVNSNSISGKSKDSKPKESSQSSNSKVVKHKENSSVSTPKDGHSSINKLSKEHKSSSESSAKSKHESSKTTNSSGVGKDHGGGGDKVKISSSKSKENSGSHSSSSISKKPKEGSSTGGGSSKPKEGTSTGSSKPKEGSSSGSSKPKESSSSSSSKIKAAEAPKPNEGSASASNEKKSSTSPVKKIKEEKGDDKHKDEKTHRDKENKEHTKDKNKEGVSNKDKLKERQKENKEVKEKSGHKEKRDSKSHMTIKSEPSMKVKSNSDCSKTTSPTKVKEELGSNGRHVTSPVRNESGKSSSKSVSVKVKEEPLSDDDLPIADRAKHSQKHKEMKKEKHFSGDSEEDEPLSARLEKTKAVKTEPPSAKKHREKRPVEDSEEDEPLSARLQKTKKVKKEAPPPKKRKIEEYSSEDEPISKKQKKAKEQKKTANASPTKRKKEEEGTDVWKWWEEEKLDNGVKWKSLEHKGPVFAPDYEPLPKEIKFYYDGKHVHLAPETEEVATFYSKLLDHEYTTKDVFNKNFFKDWRKVMTPSEKELITDLKKCNFSKMHTYFLQKNEERKNRTKEEKQELKKQNDEIQKEYGFCIIDGHKEKIGNFKIEPPGLFRGRGEHPKMGMLKKRTQPEHVIINCSKGSKVPQPPTGHKWKEVRHDNTVTWLACWQENIQGQTKYIMLNPSSKLKGEKDWQKYETARRLKGCVDKIRKTYREDWRSKEMKVRQRAVALYFIDKLALRAGNEKEEGETADTVGCCSLRVEHITLDKEKDGQDYVVSFDFLGKDSIRYVNSVSVEKQVYKNLILFMENKQPGDDLFDRLNTTILNKHLNELMEGLTAKVFRTYNASKTLQEQLALLTDESENMHAKILSYNRANRAVAILCNHQRSVPKTFGKSMENLQAKIKVKKDQVKAAEKEYKSLKKELKGSRSEKDRTLLQRKEKAVDRAKEQLLKLELSATDKEENKQIALGTSKLNYLDPRISVAWCKKHEVPIDKVYNRTQRDKFRWAIEMAGPDFVF